MPYRQEDVRFTSDGIALGGTLTRPKASTRHAAVVLLNGSGPLNRDEEVYGWKPFQVIADHLTRAGLAVLRYDSRGVGDSGGAVYQSGLQDVAADALAAVRYLKEREDLDSHCIGLCGHSQGGIAAPLCAAESDDVAFVICISGTGLPGDEVFAAQQKAIALADGTAESEWEEDQRDLRSFVDLVRANTPNADLETVVRTLVRRQLTRKAKLAEPAQGIEEADLESKVECILRGYNTRWFRSFLDYDPAPALAKLQCPILLVFGDLDLQVAAEPNRRAMVQALLRGSNRDFTVRTFPRANHLFQVALTGSPNEYGRLGKEFLPGFLDYLTGWILTRTDRTGRAGKDGALVRSIATHDEEPETERKTRKGLVYG
jgi:dienelactone hydrolase